jgi:hypothetical protein
MNNSTNTLATQHINAETAKNASILTAMYSVALNKVPDAEGFQYWMNEMANGKTIYDIAKIWQSYIPTFGDLDNTRIVINTFSTNGYKHNASQDVLNYWGVLALSAVPSYELMYDMSVQLVGQPNEYQSFHGNYL